MNAPTEAVAASTPISRYPVPELMDLPLDIRERIVAVQEKAGLVSDVFIAFAHRPAGFRASSTCCDERS